MSQQVTKTHEIGAALNRALCGVRDATTEAERTEYENAALVLADMLKLGSMSGPDATYARTADGWQIRRF